MRNARHRLRAASRMSSFCPTARIDRMGDVIEPAGWQLDKLKSDPPVLFNHDRGQVVGRWTNVRVKDGKLIGKIVWVKSDKWPMAQYIRDLVREGILRTVSRRVPAVGAAAADQGGRPDARPVQVSSSNRCSNARLVSVPANPNALALAKDFPRDVLAEVFRKPAETQDELRTVSAKPGKPSVPETTKMQTQTIGQKIQAAQQNLSCCANA